MHRTWNNGKHLQVYRSSADCALRSIKWIFYKFSVDALKVLQQLVCGRACIKHHHVKATANVNVDINVNINLYSA